MGTLFAQVCFLRHERQRRGGKVMYMAVDMASVRTLLVKSKHQDLKLESLDPSETVYKAIIIRDFMKEKNISDIRQGIREFFTFQRERLQQMGWMSTPYWKGETKPEACPSL
jgi:hypothetical protein